MAGCHRCAAAAVASSSSSFSTAAAASTTSTTASFLLFRRFCHGRVRGVVGGRTTTSAIAPSSSAAAAAAPSSSSSSSLLMLSRFLLRRRIRSSLLHFRSVAGCSSSIVVVGGGGNFSGSASPHSFALRRCCRLDDHDRSSSLLFDACAPPVAASATRLVRFGHRPLLLARAYHPNDEGRWLGSPSVRFHSTSKGGSKSYGGSDGWGEGGSTGMTQKDKREKQEKLLKLRNKKPTTTSKKKRGLEQRWQSDAFRSAEEKNKEGIRNDDRKSKGTAASNRGGGGGAAAGRVVVIDPTLSHKPTKIGRHKKKPKLCAGCGVEIVHGSGGSANDNSAAAETVETAYNTSMKGGHDAATASYAATGRGRKAQKYARYADVVELSTPPTSTPRSQQLKQKPAKQLCQRCKSLQRNDIWSAYDALRDVSPTVFQSQLKHIVTRRKFGLCLAVIDASDVEGTIIPGLRNIVGRTPVWLVVNKIDLLPYYDEYYTLKYIKRRVEQRGVKVVSVNAVSATRNKGITQLAEDLLSNLGGRDVFVVGAANVGKSSLVKVLSTTIGEAVWLQGKSVRDAERRRHAVTMNDDGVGGGGLNITASHLPGTTLQAVRVPCFESDRHALWDTPGILTDSSLVYKVFPCHVMEPLARPLALEVKGPYRVRGGQSLLMEANWMATGDDGDKDNDFERDGRNNNDDEEEAGLGEDSDKKDGLTQDVATSRLNSTPSSSTKQPSSPQPSPQPVLARLDVVEATAKRGVEIYAYVPPCIDVRVVSTSEAPSHAVIPKSHVDSVRRRVGDDLNNDGDNDSNDADDDDDDDARLPKHGFKSELQSFDQAGLVRPSAATEHKWTRSLDVAFASLGWVSVTSHGAGSTFELDPKVVKGSRWFKREPGMYRAADVVGRTKKKSRRRGGEKAGKDDGYYEEEEEEEEEKWIDFDDEMDTRQRLRDAAKKGRHFTNRWSREKGRSDVEDDEEDQWSSYGHVNRW